jgi:tetratricopeptide (TPR) repeat protein
MFLKIRLRQWISTFLVASVLSLLCIPRAVAQDTLPLTLSAPGSNPADGISQASAVNIYVSVRESNGLPFGESANVKLSCPLVGVSLSGPTKNTGLAQFFSIPKGDCNVEVTAPGFKPSRERTTVTDSYASRNQYIYVYLHSESEPASAPSRPVPLNVMKEIDKGLEAMNKNRLDDSRKHFAKAALIAPRNPDLLYLLGMVDYRQNSLDAAQKRFESALSYYPTHERALVALGEVQLKDTQYSAAQQTLQKALTVNRAAWRTHLLLANAYAQQLEYAKAESEAETAAGLAGENAPVARAFLAQIVAAEKVRQTGATLVATAPRAHGDAAGFTTPGNPTLKVPDLSIAPANLAPISPSAMLAWAPPNVDAVSPGVAPDVSCSADDIAARVALATTEQLDNFEKFVATEHIEHQEVDEYGRPTHVKTRDFSYLAFIDHDKDGQVFLDERRDGGKGVDDFPTGLATMGLLGLGVDVFHPGFASSLQFKCEGLGQWQGRPVWLIHFEQRSGQRSYLRLWQGKRATYEIPLKGRVWLSAGTYQVLHIESDLREPQNDLELTRDHLVIDYGPVNFEHSKTQLWLPWYADMYLELHGHRYHHRHTLSNYALFSVDTTNKVGAPKQEPPKEETPSPQ